MVNAVCGCWAGAFFLAERTEWIVPLEFGSKLLPAGGIIEAVCVCLWWLVGRQMGEILERIMCWRQGGHYSTPSATALLVRNMMAALTQ